MDREKILRRIVGPLPFHNGNMKWEFVARRRVRPGMPGHGSDQGGRFMITYDPRSRKFAAHCLRRVSKKRKRENVVVSRQMTAYLQSRLLPKQIALCMAASIAHPINQ